MYVETDKRPTVFVVDDDRSVRESIEFLARGAGYGCAGFASAEAALEGVSADAPGCLVVDLRLPGRSGLELLDRLPAAPTRRPAIVLTGFGDVPSVVRATKAGAIGFIEKPFGPQVLLQHIHEAMHIDRRARQEAMRRDEIRARLALLTPREREVLEMIITGKANRDIATALHRSKKTIEVHRTHVMKKMRAGNVADLVRMALGQPGVLSQSEIPLSRPGPSSAGIPGDPIACGERDAKPSSARRSGAIAASGLEDEAWRQGA